MTTPEPANPADSAPVPADARRAHIIPGSLAGRVILPARDLDSRLEDIVTTIEEFAALRFDARAPIGPRGDVIDAIAGGVNFLGEELEASFSEIERRVADRTAELSIATRELTRRALHDELTGLPNRALFWEHLSHRVRVADRQKTRFAVLFLDVDGFKDVNDTLGHAAGDQLLVDLASRLRAALRAGDTAARVGGDEFVVLVDDVASEQAAMLVAERLGEALGRPYEIEGRQVIAPASIGVAVGPDGPDGPATADEVVAAADTAMYEAKRRGGGRSLLYSEARHRRAYRPPGDSLG